MEPNNRQIPYQNQGQPIVEQPNYPNYAPLGQNNNPNPHANYNYIPPLPISHRNQFSYPNLQIAQPVPPSLRNDHLRVQQPYQNLSANNTYLGANNFDQYGNQPYGFNNENNAQNYGNPQKNYININQNQLLINQNLLGYKEIGSKITNMAITIILWDILFLLGQFFFIFVPIVYFLIYNIIDLLTFAIVWRVSVKQGRATLGAFQNYRTLIIAQLIFSVVVLLILAIVVSSTSDRWAGVIMIYVIGVALLYQIPKMILLCTFTQPQILLNQQLAQAWNANHQPIISNGFHNSNERIIYSNNGEANYQRI